jgi:hypothetical protein
VRRRPTGQFRPRGATALRRHVIAPALGAGTSRALRRRRRHSVSRCTTPDDSVATRSYRRPTSSA